MDAIKKAYDALRHHTQTVSDGGYPTIEGMRRAVAAWCEVAADQQTASTDGELWGLESWLRQQAAALRTDIERGDG